MRYHVSYNTESCHSAYVGFGAVVCPTVSDPASLLRSTLTLPHVSRLWTSPRHGCELRCHHKSHGSKACLSMPEGSVLTHVSWLSIGHRL
jgi:hypothetical protein